MIYLYTNNKELYHTISSLCEVELVHSLENLKAKQNIFIHIDKICSKDIEYIISIPINNNVTYIVEPKAALYIYSIIENNVSSFILTTEIAEQFLDLLMVVKYSGCYISKYFQTILQLQYTTTLLTKRDLLILELLINGQTYNEIANITYLSYGTVRNYVSNILNVLEFSNKTQLALHFNSILSYKKNAD